MLFILVRDTVSGTTESNPPHRKEQRNQEETGAAFECATVYQVQPSPTHPIKE